jgi:hypothetical protein
LRLPVNRNATPMTTPASPASDEQTAAATVDPLEGLMNRRAWRWGIRIAVIAPIVVAAVRALATGWFPVGDDALLAVRSYDVGTSATPWLGSWTSASLALGIDVNNPGPLYFDVVAPAMWTVGRLGSIGAGTAVGVGVVNAATAWGVMVVGRRLGGWRLERWMMLLVAALGWAMGSALLIDIWQPHALLLPFVALLVLTIGLLCDDWRLLPWWVLTASVVVQTHVAYVYVVAVLGLIVGFNGLAGLRDRGVGVVLRSSTVWWSLAVAALAWIQPIGEQLFGRGQGNLSRLASALGEGDVTIGAGQGAKLVAAVIAVPPGWTRFGFADSVISTPLAQSDGEPVIMIVGLPSRMTAGAGLTIVVALLVLMLVWAIRRHRRLERSALVVSVAVVITALAGLATQAVTVAGFGNHQVRWLFALGAFVHVVLLWTLSEWAASRWLSTTRIVAVAVPVLIAVATVWNLVPQAHPLGPTADQAAHDTLERTFVDLAEFDPGGPVVFDVGNIRVFEPYSSAVIMRLRELGVGVRFDDEVMVRQYGEHRRADGGEVGVMRQYEAIAALTYEGPGCVLTIRSGVADPERAEELANAAADELTGAPIDTGGLHPDLAATADAAAAGDRDAAFRLVASGFVEILVEEGRVEAGPATDAVVASIDEVVDWAETTLAIVVEPASLCTHPPG